MKKLFTISIVVVLYITIFNAKAQLVTISETNQMPAIGDSIHYVDANTFGFDATGVGPVTAKVWDFSALMNTGTSVDFTYVDPSTLTPSDGRDSFPTANIARGESDASGYFYYQNTANDINRLGAYVSATNHLIYKDGTVATEFHFPITAGGNFNSTYHGRYSPFGVGEDSVTVESGTLTINADMQGQMILPTGTFNQVLRLHVIESFHIKAYVFGTPATDNIISDDYYYWFVDSIKLPLFIYGVTSQDGTPQTPVLRYQPISSPLTITNNNNDVTNVYPNPSNGIFTINTGKNFVEKIEISNSLGQVVYENLKPLSNNLKIDLSKFSKGEYFVKVYNNEKFYISKIVLY